METTKTINHDTGYQQYIASKLQDVIEHQKIDSVEICGGLRRKWPDNKKIDIVIQADDNMKLFRLHSELWWRLRNHQVITMEIKPQLITFEIDAIPVSIHIGRNSQQYEVLKLIKTGDNAFIHLLSVRAIQMNLVLRHSFKDKLFGLYGLYKEYDRKTRKFNTTLNPYRVEARTENDIIEKLFPGESKYRDPVNRSLADIAVEVT